MENLAATMDASYLDARSYNAAGRYIRAAPISPNTTKLPEVEGAKVAYVVFHGRDNGIFYNWYVAVTSLSLTIA